jgi:hypothetical protein
LKFILSAFLSLIGGIEQNYRRFIVLFMAWPLTDCIVHSLATEDENGGIVCTLKCKRKQISASSETGRFIYGFPLIVFQMYKLMKLD